MTATEIIVPASTSNLGASFDTCGLALALYLKVTIEDRSQGFQVTTRGEGADRLPRDESNLIARVARSVSELRGKRIEGARITVDNQIFLARGLGSSSAAIIAGISLYEALAEDQIPEDEFFSYALRFEQHGDNLAPSLLGGMVVACVVERAAKERSLVTVKRDWPDEVKVVLCVPDFEMDTNQMRSVLPREVTLGDAVFNVQRSALLQALIAERRFELFSEALRDRLHQRHRTPLGPGLNEVLKLNEEKRDHPGLLGVAVSGAGPTMIAFVANNASETGEEMRRRFETAGVRSSVLEVEVDNRGRIVRKTE